jgi:hypothetical protein
MTPEKQQAIFDLYPALYSDREKPMTETCMCWGLACGDGWYGILRDLTKQIRYLDERCHFATRATQVKEKFGTLSFYYTTRPLTAFSDVETYGDILYAVIHNVELVSEYVCETCGDKVTACIRGTSWLYVRCDACWAELKSELGIIEEGDSHV